MTVANSLVFLCDGIEIREQEFCIIKHGEAIPVEPRAFRVLLYLLRNPQRVVTKDELLQSVWDDVAVTENSLARAILKLRQALGDDARSPHYIQTVSRIGYRFVGSVEIREVPTALTADARVGSDDALQLSSAPATVFTEARRRWRTGRWLVIASAIAIALLTGWWIRTRERMHWARATATPEIERLLEVGEYPKAAALALRAHAVLPDDVTIRNLWVRATGEVSLNSDPAGAEVFYRPYHGDPGLWTLLGRTPVSKVRVPQDSYVWRVTKPGFAVETFIANAPGTVLPGEVKIFDITLKLHPQGQVPPEMVPVGGDWSGMTYPLLGSPDVKLDDFLIDRHEVTNEEYQKFVDAGGYTRPELWKQPFVKDGRTIAWDQAMALFHDSTGRPGPATWEAGHFPTGRGNHPVAGVSWYEATAYAEFVSKSLPTAYHWMLASQADDNTPLIASGGNFGLDGTQVVGVGGTLSGWGTTDMAGNVKEWCLNEGRDGKRLILGGGFGEPDYMFNFTDAQSPWDRHANFGFRCMRHLSEPNLAAQQRVESNTRDFWNEKPAPDEIFNAYRELYAYDKDPLNARVEQVEVTERAKRERVSFDAAYGHERVTAYVFLPRQTQPPWQTVVFFPGAMATLTDALDLASVENAYDFILKSGRAIVVPIYKGTYQRRDGFIPGRNKPAFFRDHAIAWSKDLGRTLDYLETRRDFDTTKMAYLGFSLGGAEAPVLLAIEKRFKAAVLLSAGFQLRRDLPEVDGINFDPRVTTPTLVLNGRYDDDFPVELSQRPLFQFMGTPPKDKKLVIYEGGHGVFPRPAAVREVLDWLDRYLGPLR
jgi:DNA-binding winged helix-turn-helix (wHTH) protein/dienelactone hydrolase